MQANFAIHVDKSCKKKPSAQTLQVFQLFCRQIPPLSGGQIAKGNLPLPDAEKPLHLEPCGGAHVSHLAVFPLADRDIDKRPILC